MIYMTGVRAGTGQERGMENSLDQRGLLNIVDQKRTSDEKEKKKKRKKSKKSEAGDRRKSVR